MQILALGEPQTRDLRVARDDREGDSHRVSDPSIDVAKTAMPSMMGPNQAELAPGTIRSRHESTIEIAAFCRQPSRWTRADKPARICGALGSEDQPFRFNPPSGFGRKRVVDHAQDLI